MTDPRPAFEAGNNIAVKTPAHEYSAMTRFYRDVLGFEITETTDNSIGFAFGDKTLWIDRCPHLTRSEVWLEVKTSDIAAAHAWLRESGIDRCDGVEPLAEDFRGFWVMAPSSLVHLVSGD